METFKKGLLTGVDFRGRRPPDSLPWEPARRQDTAFFLVGERIQAPLPPLRPRPRCNFIHPRKLSPFPERIALFK